MSPSALLGDTASMLEEVESNPKINATTLADEKTALAATERITLVDNHSDHIQANNLITTTNGFLVTSPYTDKDHLLKLESLDQENQILALALTKLKAIRDDYSTASYLDSFNWEVVIETVRWLMTELNIGFKETTCYVVAFRSRLRSAGDFPDLSVLDKAAHAEAVASGGFLKYWFGTPDRNLCNLATCIWRSHEDAKKGSVGPNHRRAAISARHHYSKWDIDQHCLIIRDGAASWEIVKW